MSAGAPTAMRPRSGDITTAAASVVTIASNRSGDTLPSPAAKRSSSNSVTLPVIVESVASAIGTWAGISSTAAVTPKR